MEFDNTRAVLKIILNANDATSELEGWAEGGYLLAYATQRLRDRSLIFLILRTSDSTPPSMKFEGEGLWKAARESAAKLKSPIMYEACFANLNGLR